MAGYEHPSGPVAERFAARMREREERDSVAAGGAAPIRPPRATPEPDCGLRTPFQRDRDRIVHSKAFRRLKHKTQVFVAPSGDHYRTRLTHTLEVTQVSRTVARALALNEDLVEAIGLGHDLGHPPFGHVGEDALDRCLQRALRGRLSPPRAFAAGGRHARARRARPEPDRAGPRRDRQPLGPRRAAGDAGGPDRPPRRPRRLHQPRHRRRRPGRRAGAGRPAGGADRDPRGDRPAADRHARPRPRRALGSSPATSSRARRSAAAMAELRDVHVRRVYLGPVATREHAKIDVVIGRCSSTTAPIRRRSRPRSPPASCRAGDRLHGRDDRPLLHPHVRAARVPVAFAP